MRTFGNLESSKRENCFRITQSFKNIILKIYLAEESIYIVRGLIYIISLYKRNQFFFFNYSNQFRVINYGLECSNLCALGRKTQLLLLIWNQESTLLCCSRASNVPPRLRPHCKYTSPTYYQQTWSCGTKTAQKHLKLGVRLVGRVGSRTDSVVQIRSCRNWCQRNEQQRECVRVGILLDPILLEITGTWTEA